MRFRQLTVGATLTAAISMVPGAVAFASGPGGGSGNGSGNNGRSVIDITCGGQPFTVAVTNGGNSNGAGQIVDAKGHGIPAAGTFTATDTTAGVVLFSGTAGNTHGHQNQTQTECTGTQFTGTVADLGPPPPGGYPSGVLPSDTVVGTFDIFVVLKA